MDVGGCSNRQGIGNAGAVCTRIALQNGTRKGLLAGHGFIETTHTGGRTTSVVEFRLPFVFGLLVVRIVEIGLITPPVGLNVYILKGGAPGVMMGDMFRGFGWFVFVDLINVAILITFPLIILLISPTLLQ